MDMMPGLHLWTVPLLCAPLSASPSLPIFCRSLYDDDNGHGACYDSVPLSRWVKGACLDHPGRYTTAGGPLRARRARAPRRCGATRECSMTREQRGEEKGKLNKITAAKQRVPGLHRPFYGPGVDDERRSQGEYTHTQFTGDAVYAKAFPNTTGAVRN